MVSEIVLGIQVQVSIGLLGGKTYPSPYLPCLRLGIRTQHANLAAVSGEHAGNQIDGGGFAGADRPQQTEYLATMCLERERVYGYQLTEAAGHQFCTDGIIYA